MFSILFFFLFWAFWYFVQFLNSTIQFDMADFYFSIWYFSPFFNGVSIINEKDEGGPTKVEIWHRLCLKINFPPPPIFLPPEGPTQQAFPFFFLIFALTSVPSNHETAGFLKMPRDHAITF